MCTIATLYYYQKLFEDVVGIIYGYVKEQIFIYFNISKTKVESRFTVLHLLAKQSLSTFSAQFISY